MPTRRLFAALAVAITAFAAAAVPAAAHEEINPSTIPTGKPTFFTLTAANEKSADVTKVVLAAPAGRSLGESTRSPAGWTANHTDAAITWTGGKVAPNTFEQFGFEIDGADQPGTLSFKVTLTAGSDSDDSTVPVSVVAGTGTATPPATAGPTVTASPPTTASGSTATTAALATGEAASPALAKSVSDAKDKSDTATTLAIVGLALAAIALAVAVVALVRRSRTSAAVPQDF